MQTTVMALYEQLAQLRHDFLDRAQAGAKLTIPTLLPPTGHTSASTLPTPWQSIGARGVNNLASKLLITLFQPNAPFFRFKVDEATLAALIGGDEKKAKEVRAEFDKSLAGMERQVKDEIEALQARPKMFEALKQLLVAGNVLIQMTKERNIRVFRLDRYVTKRDPMGNLLTVITKEDLSPLTLSQEVRELIGFTQQEETGSETVELYTIMQRQPSRSGKMQWVTWQEVKGKEIPGTKGNFPIDRSPYLALRLFTVDGEHYGRGYVEEYLGDLISLEGLTRAIVEGSAAAAKVLFLVRPNGSTKQETISRAPNGSVANGDVNDVGVLRLEKQGDFRVALETMRDIRDRLQLAFLLNSAVQRQAERVTAEEVRFMAQELENGLGGIYTSLTQELQFPLVTNVVFDMQRRGALAKFPKLGGKETITPIITTGLEALGRGQDLNRLRGFVDDVGVVAQADPTILQRIDAVDLLTRLATARGVDPDGMILDEDAFQAKQQQAQMMQLAQAAGPDAIKQGLQNASAPQ